MPPDVRHLFVSPVAAGTSNRLVQGPNWNEAHNLQQGPQALLGRSDSTPGQAPTTEVLLDPVTMQFTGGKLAALVSPQMVQDAVAGSFRINALSFGVSPSATAAANATALIAFFNACDGHAGYIPSGSISTNAVNITNTSGLDILCDATFVNAAGAGQTADLLFFTGSNVGAFRWKGGVFNMAASPRSALSVIKVAEVDIDVDEGYGITAVDGPSNGSVSIVNIQDTPVVQARVRYGHDMVGTAAPILGSVPRVVSVAASASYATRMDANIQVDTAIGIHDYIVIGNMRGGVANIYRGYVRGAGDNVVYNVGDASEVNAHDIFADDVDEMFVNSGTGTINIYRAIGRNLRNAIGLQNCAAINVYDSDLQFANGVSPFKTRTGNTSSGAFRIHRSRIDATPTVRMCDFATVGTLDEFIDKRNTWTYRYNSAVWTGTGGASNSILTMTAGTRGRVESDSDWVLVDTTANVPASTQFLIAVPTVTELSYWDSRHINRTGVSTTVLRLASARQQLFSFRNKFSVSNIQSETEENNGGLATAPPRETFSTLVPSTGYWPARSVVKLAPALWAAKAHHCTTGGSPGTWINEGFCPVLLSGTTTIDIASIAAGGTSASFTVTVTGATTPDIVIGMSIATPNTGVALHGWVSSSNTVTVFARNYSAGAVDLPSATVTVVVMKTS